MQPSRPCQFGSRDRAGWRYCNSLKFQCFKNSAGLGLEPRKAAATPDIPPAKASMVRVAIRARFSPARVAKDFGVSVAMVRKLAAT
jgi:hypothetical protein